MKFAGYISGLLSFFKDQRIIRNVEQLLLKIIENKTVRIWSMSNDKAEFSRYKSLIDGSLKSILDDEKISQALRENSVEVMSGQKQIILIHDPCDIRKKYSNDLEHLGKVLDLEKNVINGYSTFNTIAVDEKHKRVHFVDLKVYSNKEPHFVTEKELKQYQEGRSTKSQNLDERQRAKIIEELVMEDEYINLLRITYEQLAKSSQAFKAANSKVHITHVLDSGFDDQKKFQFIDKTLKDEFVIRIKLSRNSSEISVDEENKPRYLKLKNVKFAKSKRFPIKKLVIKNKVYQKATCLIEYDDYHIEKQTYTAVRVTLKDCQGQKIFKEPMLLLTNRKIKTLEQAYGIYFIYMQRSKIENVFKFLKEILGWEEFQVRDFESIKNIVALCFFVGGYFYEIESELIENVNFQYLCDLGGGKGQYTRHFFLKGLAKILTVKSVDQFIQKQGISNEEFQQMKDVLIY